MFFCFFFGTVAPKYVVKREIASCAAGQNDAFAKTPVLWFFFSPPGKRFTELLCCKFFYNYPKTFGEAHQKPMGAWTFVGVWAKNIHKNPQKHDQPFAKGAKVFSWAKNTQKKPAKKPTKGPFKFFTTPPFFYLIVL